MTRIHLGCGDIHLGGYLNVDQPASAHTVQVGGAADAHGDITSLRWPAESVDEVRLHHVFEHFQRPVAMALAAGWASWLRPGGTLHIEVPDLVRTGRAVLNPFRSRRARLVGIRHLFGSHEAPWATHCEGWSAETLSRVFEHSGIRVKKVRRTRWLDTYNIHVIGHRDEAAPAVPEVTRRARGWLANYLVDETPGELRILEVWMDAFAGQLARTWALPHGSTGPAGLVLVGGRKP